MGESQDFQGGFDLESYIEEAEERNERRMEEDLAYM